MPEILANLPDTVRTAALERFRLIRPFLEEGMPLPTLARQHGLSLRTARRWVQRYRTGGWVRWGVSPGETKAHAGRCPHSWSSS